jgi:hypothetical protein
MSWGFVYVLGNDCMPGIYKIGMTEKAPQERLEQLSSSTSVPEPFWMAFYAQVKGAPDVERAMHDEFDEHRVNPSREFFRVSLRDLRDAIEFHAEPPMIHDVAFEPEAFLEEREQKRQQRLHHFLGQNPDPYQWEKHRGFE